MSDVLFDGSGAMPSGASSGSSVEQLTDKFSSGSSVEQLTDEFSIGSYNASVPDTQDVPETLLYVDSGSVNGLTTFNNNFVTLSFVIIFLLSAIFGTLLFTLLKDFFK